MAGLAAAVGPAAAQEADRAAATEDEAAASHADGEQADGPPTAADVVELLRQRAEAEAGGADKDAPGSALARLQRLLREPDEPRSGEELREHLDGLIDTASEVALTRGEGPLRLGVLSVQMQAIHLRLMTFPEAEDFDRLLARLRGTARRVKAMDVPESAAMGDFWQLTAEMIDVNRSGLALADRQAQAAQLIADFLERHPDSVPAESARASLQQLRVARRAAAQGTERVRPEAAGAGERVLDPEQIASVTVDDARLSGYWQRRYQPRKLSQQQVRRALTTWRRVSPEAWGQAERSPWQGDRSGTLTLTDGRTVRWRLRPDGLARLTFPEGAVVHLSD